MKVCIRCGSGLEQNPIHPHWHHCPNCDPRWVAFGRNMRRINHLDQLVTKATTDKRGRPSIGGVKQ